MEDYLDMQLLAKTFRVPLNDNLKLVDYFPFIFVKLALGFKKYFSIGSLES